jgi:DNA-binding transcriptional ArsR family regulator
VFEADAGTIYAALLRVSMTKETNEGTEETIEEAVEEGSVPSETVELRHEHEIHIDKAVDEVEETVKEQRRKVQDRAGEALDTVEETIDEVDEKREEVGERIETEAEDTLEDVEDRAEDVGRRLDDVLGAVDDSVTRLLSEALDTDTRVAVYATLRKIDGGSIEDISEENGMYPRTVGSVLQDLEEDEVVEIEDGEYRAVPPTRLVTAVPGLLADRIGGVRDKEGGETSVEAEYDEENEEVTVRVVRAGEADYLNVLVDGEVRHTFQSPGDGDEVSIKADPDADLTAESGTVRYD